MNSGHGAQGTGHRAPGTGRSRATPSVLAASANPQSAIRIPHSPLDPPAPQPPRTHYWLPRTIWPTREGWWFIGATMAIGLAATNTGNNLLYLILAMMLSFLVISGMLSEQTMRHVRARREVPRRLFAGTAATVGVSLTNRKRRLPSYALHLSEADPGSSEARAHFFLKIAARSQDTWQYVLAFPRRGRHSFPGLRLFTRFPFGLFAKISRPLLVDPVLVYPAIRPLAPDEIPAVMDPGWRERSRRGHGAGLYNLRPYRPGDDPRQIHWKTSARTGDLVLKETEDEDRPRVRIAIEDPAPEAPTSVVEADIGYAASLAAHAIRRGIQVQMATPEGATEFGQGEVHLDRILERLALYLRPAAPRPGPALDDEARTVQIRLGAASRRAQARP